MKAITLTQPWATLVAVGAKSIETRGWSTSYRGPIAIHAAKTMPHECAELSLTEPYRSALKGAAHVIGTKTLGETCPRGVVVAVAELTGVCRFAPESLERIRANTQLPVFEMAFGDYSLGRYGFQLSNVRRVVSREVRGMLGLWELPEDIAELCRRAP